MSCSDLKHHTSKHMFYICLFVFWLLWLFANIFYDRDLRKLMEGCQILFATKVWCSHLVCEEWWIDGCGVSSHAVAHQEDAQKNSQACVHRKLHYGEPVWIQSRGAWSMRWGHWLERVGFVKRSNFKIFQLLVDKSEWKTNWRWHWNSGETQGLPVQRGQQMRSRPNGQFVCSPWLCRRPSLANSFVLT